MRCFRPTGCGKASCAFAGQKWRAPMVSFDAAIRATLPTSAVVVINDDLFSMGDYDAGWDLEIEGY